MSRAAVVDQLSPDLMDPRLEPLAAVLVDLVVAEFTRELEANEHPGVRAMPECKDDARMQHFTALTHVEKTAAIRRMANDGYTDLAIADATRLSREMVCQILARRDVTTSSEAK